MSYRIAHLGDLHLGRRWLSVRDESGANQREVDLHRAVGAVGEWLQAEKPDLVVIAGDLFDSVTPSTVAQGVAFRLVAGLKAQGIEVVIIAGNHDWAPGRTVSPLTLLADFFGATLFLEPGHLDVGPVRLHALPYKAIAAAADGQLPLPLMEFAPDRPNLLAAHSYVHHPLAGQVPERIVLPDEVWTDPRLALVMMGHIHRHGPLAREGEEDRAFYCGPLERLNFGEGEVDPAFYIHTIDDGGLRAVRAVRVGEICPDLPRPMLRLDVAQGEMDLDALDARVRAQIAQEVVVGAIVRLQLLECEEALRESALPRVWREDALSRGAIHCEVSLTVRGRELSEPGRGAALPTRLDDAYRSYLAEAGREDLIEDALALLREVGG